MGWIYLAASAESQKPWTATSGLSPTVKSTDTLRVSSYLEWQRETSLSLLSGTTFRHYADPTYPDHPTSSTAVFPVRTLALPVGEKAWEESEAVYFSRSLGSLAKYDPASSSWKTYLISEPTGPTLCSKKWPAYGMTVDGVCYPLRMWERTTREKGGGYWRTQDANMERGTRSKKNLAGRMERKMPLNLNDQLNAIDKGLLAPPMWPTPRAGKTSSENPETWKKRQEKGDVATPPLGMAVKMWPTPRVGGQERYETRAKRKGHDEAMTYLESAVDYFEREKWPTPRASEWKGCGPKGSKSQKYRLNKGYLDATVSEREAQTGGSLNPTWVEWLMAYPSEWTVLNASVMPWFQLKRGKRLKG
jgi:hypothetical protein